MATEMSVHVRLETITHTELVKEKFLKIVLSKEKQARESTS